MITQYLLLPHEKIESAWKNLHKMKLKLQSGQMVKVPVSLFFKVDGELVEGVPLEFADQIDLSRFAVEEITFLWTGSQIVVVE